eukprot:UN04976
MGAYFSQAGTDNTDIKAIPRRSFYFVRHGQTNWGKDDILKGPLDLSLNSEGEEQAQKAGDRLQHLLPKECDNIIVSSTLQRAVETATIISNITNTSRIGKEYDMRERYYGDYRLLIQSNKSQQNEEIFEQTPGDAESKHNFEKRVIKCLEKILTKYEVENCNLVIVSHQKVFQHLNKLFGGGQQRLNQGGICHFVPRSDGTNIWELRKLL